MRIAEWYDARCKHAEDQLRYAGSKDEKRYDICPVCHTEGVDADGDPCANCDGAGHIDRVASDPPPAPTDVDDEAYIVFNAWMFIEQHGLAAWYLSHGWSADRVADGFGPCPLLLDRIDILGSAIALLAHEREVARAEEAENERRAKGSPS